MRSMTTTQYLLNIALVSLVVLQIRGHAITRARLLFPIVLTVWAASQFLHGIPTAGSDLVLEFALVLVGGVLGVLAASATKVRLIGSGAVAKAGPVAAALWVIGIGARVGFSLWVTHGGQPMIVRFSSTFHITSGHAWTAAFVLMATAEVATRGAVLFAKARRIGAEIPRGGLRQRSAIA